MTRQSIDRTKKEGKVDRRLLCIVMVFLLNVTVFGQTLIFNSGMDVRASKDPRPSPSYVEQLRAGASCRRLEMP
ncbi:MAG: hypothetical protein JRI33_07990 [Deltaproteobacteria bacterium]|nr:hypothetical protein [Deltaproteobacteria bacterium]